MVSGLSLSAKLRAWRGRVPVDLIAFLVIAVVIPLTHMRFMRHGMNFNDASWYLHFGRRILDGDVPYRDFLFQVGPLPMYVDAAFQELFGSRYVASLGAALFIKVLRVTVVWMIARRVAGWPAALGVTFFCMFDLHFAHGYHWSIPYAQLFVSAAGLFLVMAAGADGRRNLTYLALAGFSVAMVVSARQSAFVTVTAMLLVGSASLLVRRDTLTRQRFLALWAGFAAGVALIAIALAAIGALGPAIQQLFLDAPQKKAARGIKVVLDALSNGALVDPYHTWWGGFLLFNALPVAVVGALIALLANRDRIRPESVLMLVVPAWLLVGLFTRYAELNLFSDLPHVFLTAIAAIAVLSPERGRRWLGLEPLVAIGLGALPLAVNWAAEMSLPGRGWPDTQSLCAGAVLIAIASRLVSARARTMLCAGLALVAIVHVAVFRDGDRNPFTNGNVTDGTTHANRFSPRPRGEPHPMLRGMRLTTWRRTIVEWLASQIPPGSTCFVYGNLPILYDLVPCKNPTRLDSTVVDFMTERDATEAASTMQANPPDFIISSDRSWQSAPLVQDLEGKLERYDWMNPKANRALHMGIRVIFDRYEDLGKVADVLGPELTAEAASQWDTIDGLHLYRLKR